MTAIEEAVAGYSEEEKPLGSYATLFHRASGSRTWR
jgi:hypothetical protein